MKVSVIIPNFNGSALLMKNLPAVLSAAESAEIIVVDDVSTDDSLSVLKTHFPTVKVIARKKNEGFASAVNDGVQNASGDLVLLLNSDVIPQKDFLGYLTSHFQNRQVFAVGCLQKGHDGQGLTKQGRGIGKFGKGFLVHAPGTLDKTNTLWVFGGATMYSKEMWKKLGGMDTVYNPFYWEDIDLSYRALKAGFKLVFDSRSIVVHDQAGGVIRNLYTPEEINIVAFRNQILFVWLNITDFSLLMNHLVYLPYHLLKSLFTGNFAFIKAFFQAIPKIPLVLRSRVRNRKFAAISDRKIFSNFTV